MDKANSPFILSHDLPKVSTAGMDYVLGFLTSLADLRKARDVNTASAQAAVAGLELRMRNAHLLDAYGDF
eukprot:4452927-Prorocentrum_lima.AAC.1